MEKQTQTFSELLHSIDQPTPSSPRKSPSPTPPPSFTYLPELNTTPSSFLPNSQKDPYSYSPPRSFTTSAPVKVFTYVNMSYNK